MMGRLEQSRLMLHYRLTAAEAEALPADLGMAMLETLRDRGL